MDYAAVTMAVRRFLPACKLDRTLAKLSERVIKRLICNRLRSVTPRTKGFPDSGRGADSGISTITIGTGSNGGDRQITRA